MFSTVWFIILISFITNNHQIVNLVYKKIIPFNVKKLLQKCEVFIFWNTFWIFRDLEDSSMDEGSIENQERGSLASFGSGNTTDSEKVLSYSVNV